MVAVVLLAFVVIFAFFLLAKDHGVVVVVPFGWRPFDVASILLATAAVVVTGVGIAIAVLAFVGWQNLKEAAKEAAIDASVKVSVEEAREKAEQTAVKTVMGFLEMSVGSKDYSGAYEEADENET